MATTPTSDRPGAFCHDCGTKHGRGNNTDRSRRWDKLTAAHGATCVWCDSAPATDQDRLVESCFYALWNLVPACKECNCARNRAEFTGRGARFYAAACKSPETARRALAIADAMPVHKRQADRAAAFRAGA